MHTLPIDTSLILDGNGTDVYVSTADPWESSIILEEVSIAAVERSRACAKRNFGKADEIHQKVDEVGY
ncbi:hypothetical protein SCA6_011040 [Theobroma cacao]